ncbi:MAG: mercuric transporter MerT family protein [Thermoanaerobaculia bacterium]|jgi:mercuric ion transport protein
MAIKSSQPNRGRPLRTAGLAASVVAAAGASVCCIGPLAAAVLGIGSLGGLVRYEPLRPFFTLLTLGLLGGAFYLTYRKSPADQCAPDSLCATHGPDRIGKLNRLVLWVVSAVALALLTFPAWSGWILG